MGEVSDTTMTMQHQKKRKKKKGRPSLLDLQKRSLKQQQQQQQQIPNPIHLSPHYTRRSTSRNSYSDQPEWVSGSGEDDERKEKKHKLLNGLNPHPHYPTLSQNSLSFSSNPYASDSNANVEDTEAAIKRRNISPVPYASDAMGDKLLKATDTLNGSQVESGPTTPLPDKKLLVFILDRLQKKDTHGVFSEPVDPEELPDYHEIIENPMDFGTVRKKLDGGAYANLEQFEKDVFLICTNAMQYNAPDTIFFRQARSMQELANKNFENLRQDSDDNEPQPKVVRRGRPPGKNPRKSLDRAPFDHVCPEPAFDASLASEGGNARGANAYNLRKGQPSYRFPPADTVLRASHGSRNSETCTSWWPEWENEFPASVLKGVVKYGKKQFAIDENKRDTYKDFLDSGHGPSVMATLEGDWKQLMAVGLNLEDGYARSLTQFAADLGPVVWKIASKKIERVLPFGLKFGPGWIGENEALNQEQSSESSISDDGKSKLPYHVTSESNMAFANGSLLQAQAERTGFDSQFELTSLKSSVGGKKSMPPLEIQPKSLVCSDMDRSNGGLGSGFLSQIRMVSLSRLTGMSCSDDTSLPSQALETNSSNNTTIYQMPRNDVESNETRFSEIARTNSGNLLALGPGLKSHGTAEVMLGGESSWERLLMHHSFPPDLNVRIQQTSSTSSNVQIGSPQQPDLVLQL
ncbi:hypothetical protein I3760_07G135800 [Carya illinoinensis]|uniref:Bromo domain-containing protein n=2 Tax=Carya illinoinensis TaxID=32201 RepID=A0A922EJ03_CARIL|nr:hypothetical protein I3760_07G135800 [Carya illinoinensis]KAG6704593.1 hypothetical protein I3842_07G140100 [Carya illinoinensis]